MAELITGFETPYSIELLGTVHHSPTRAKTSNRSSKLFKAGARASATCWSRATSGSRGSTCGSLVGDLRRKPPNERRPRSAAWLEAIADATTALNASRSERRKLVIGRAVPQVVDRFGLDRMPRC